MTVILSVLRWFFFVFAVLNAVAHVLFASSESAEADFFETRRKTLLTSTSATRRKLHAFSAVSTALLAVVLVAGRKGRS